MAEATTWDEYIKRAHRYIQNGEIESRELNYKRETERQLRRDRDRALKQPGPISITVSTKHLSNLAGYAGGILSKLKEWLGTDDGSDALRELWARDNRSPKQIPPEEAVIARVRSFADRLPQDVVGGVRSRGSRLRVISVLLMALDAEQYPPFKITEFHETYELLGYPKTPERADEAEMYEHALRFLDRLMEEAKERRFDRPRNRLEAQSVVWLDRHPTPDPKPPPRPKPERLQGLADRLLFDVKYFRRIEELLDDKRQVIFQGPPGTGKTYVARKLAASLAGAAERVHLVQFHPSYAYEDFVQGYRPSLERGQPGFKLRNGPLLEAAGRALDEPDAMHFLVIDEINRGNLAKVFGELYFLLEYRDEKMRLQYSAEAFALPENLYVIGTMNTADRSIALVDLALRRRFHFVDFHPDHPPVQGLLGRWLTQKAPDMMWVADVVDRANAMLGDGQAAIGPSCFMKDGLDEGAVRLIWEHNVLPYLEERFYGERDRLAEFALSTLRHAETEAAGEDDATD